MCVLESWQKIVVVKGVGVASHSAQVVQSMHSDALHAWPGAQSDSPVQLVAQVVPPHA
jgi:hypothetical protein